MILSGNSLELELKDLEMHFAQCEVGKLKFAHADRLWALSIMVRDRIIAAARKTAAKKDDLKN